MENWRWRVSLWMLSLHILSFKDSLEISLLFQRDLVVGFLAGCGFKYVGHSVNGFAYSLANQGLRRSLVLIANWWWRASFLNAISWVSSPSRFLGDFTSISMRYCRWFPCGMWLLSIWGIQQMVLQIPWPTKGWGGLQFWWLLPCNCFYFFEVVFGLNSCIPVVGWGSVWFSLHSRFILGIFIFLSLLVWV